LPDVEGLACAGEVDVVLASAAHQVDLFGSRRELEELPGLLRRRDFRRIRWLMFSAFP
jgi:hypothetical protein